MSTFKSEQSNLVCTHPCKQNVILYRIKGSFKTARLSTFNASAELKTNILFNIAEGYELWQYRAHTVYIHLNTYMNTNQMKWKFLRQDQHKSLISGLPGIRWNYSKSKVTGLRVFLFFFFWLSRITSQAWKSSKNTKEVLIWGILAKI